MRWTTAQLIHDQLPHATAGPYLEAVLLQLLLAIAGLIAVRDGQRHRRRQVPAKAVPHGAAATKRRILRLQNGCRGPSHLTRRPRWSTVQVRDMRKQGPEQGACSQQHTCLRAPTDCMYVRVMSALAGCACSLPRTCWMVASSSWSFRYTASAAAQK